MDRCRAIALGPRGLHDQLEQLRRHNLVEPVSILSMVLAKVTSSHIAFTTVEQPSSGRLGFAHACSEKESRTDGHACLFLRHLLNHILYIERDWSVDAPNDP